MIETKRSAVFENLKLILSSSLLYSKESPTATSFSAEIIKKKQETIETAPKTVR